MLKQDEETNETCLSSSQKEFIRSVTGLCQQIGMPRTIGEIYGLVFVSDKKLSLDEISEILSISKASVSHGVRKLKSIHAINQVYVSGSRKDYFEIRADLGKVMKDFFEAFIQPKVNKSRDKLSEIQQLLETDYNSDQLSGEHYQILKERLSNLVKLEKKINMLIPIAKKLI